tara:strand:+ start:4778 stop:5692 length:915 start_codon:yes stop_codon:yes gene_type:complete
MKIKYLLLILIFLLLPKTYVFSKINLEILYKINDQIITNIDLENEKKFLILLNPNLKKLSTVKINEISDKSIKNRKIKEIELTKIIDLNKANLGKKYVENFLLRTKFADMKNLLSQLKKADLEYNYFEKSILVDNLWREFIFNKFKSKINIDIDSLKQQINSKESETEELNLSEIFFHLDNRNFEELTNQIYTEINRSGFEAAASIFSISETKKFGGKLGWVNSNQISKEVYNEIKKIKEITSPIKINNGFLIIKINQRRKVKEQINFDKELEKLISLESEKQLNKLGYIYFNKIKKRIFISES